MAKGEQIQERWINFAVMTIDLRGMLSDTLAGRHVAGQLLESGTSRSPNYGETRGAESKWEFVHKREMASRGLKESMV